jgi:cobalt-zinc-cadmium efflux system membrane fusion protein
MPSLPYLLAVVAASQWRQALADETPLVSAAPHAAPNEIHYAPGSPQLAYLAVQAVQAQVPPVMEPLPARLAWDEDHAVRVFSPVAGRTVQILVQAGQRVKAGDVLAWLEAPEFDAALAEARKAQVDLDIKQAGKTRAEHLHEAGVIATRELENAKGDVQLAQAEWARAQAHLHSLGAGVQAAASGRFALRAPLSGVVVERHLNPGQELRPDAADPAFVITDPDHLDVVADVAESDVAHVHVGQTIRVEADGIDLSELHGRISVVGAAMDPSTRRVPVRAHLLRPSAAARPDMFVRLSVLDPDAQTAVLVPNSAIVTSGLQSFVFVERAPGNLVKTRVDFAHRGREASYISQGLQADMRIVTKGATLLDAELNTGS